MCRMLATRPATSADAVAILAGFRKQARFGQTGTPAVTRHPDGWGLVSGAGGEVERLAGSTGDAFEDPRFDEAVERAGAATGRRILLAHLRNASVGENRPENTHPFLDAGWAFAHNGTIHGSDRIAVKGALHEGDTDSERYFRRFLHDLGRFSDPATALRSTVDFIDARCAYSSLTCFFTDGATFYAYRRLGTDPAECGTEECQREHYNVGYGMRGRSLVVAQEPSHLDLDGWTGVPDGSLLAWRDGEDPVVRPLTTALRARI